MGNMVFRNCLLRLTDFAQDQEAVEDISCVCCFLRLWNSKANKYKEAGSYEMENRKD